MKKILALAVATFVALGINAQLLYKISGNKLKQPSYIVGTHHLVDGTFASKIAGLDKAMTDVAQVYGELDNDVMTNPDTLQMMASAMMMPEGKTIKDVLTADEFERLNQFCKTNIGLGLDNEMLFAQLGKLTPSSLVTQFTLILYLKNSKQKFDQQNAIDAFIQKEAKKNGKKCGGLETFNFQIGVLLKSTPMKRQVEQLMCLVDNVEENIKSAEKITQGYLNQDLNMMYEVAQEKHNDLCDSTPEEEDILIYNRNRDWAKKMPKIMSGAPTLFVVGSLHLAGDKGMVALLKNAGYKVEAVK